MAHFIHLANILVNEVIEEEDVGRRRIFHEKVDAFQLSDLHFQRLFRLSKALATNIINFVEEHTNPPSRTSALNSKIKVLTALRFFASGSYQMDVGCNIHMALSQSSVSRCIKEVVDVLNRDDVCNNWIKFPQINELENVRNMLHGFPGVIGCIDCTHVAIVPPKKDDPLHPEHIYVNRKGYHSINVQLICDSTLKILHCNARYPGSTHDNFIWTNCNVLPFLQHLDENRRGFYLLGDSGYALRPWLMTPILNAQPGTNEDRYNTCHKRTRSVIERCNGVLKMRFRCLLKHRVLHYNPEMAAKIIKACVVLHNMCIENDIPLEHENEDGEVDLGIYPQFQGNDIMGRIDPDLARGRRLQQAIVQRHFL